MSLCLTRSGFVLMMTSQSIVDEEIWGLSNLHDLTLVPAWISNPLLYKVYDEITLFYYFRICGYA